MAKKLNLEALLKKVERLDKEYWKKQFEEHDKRRLQRNRELESVILFLLDECLEDIYEYIYSFYGRYAKEGVVTSEIVNKELSATEFSSIYKFLEKLLDRAEAEGIKFDMDVENEITDLGKEFNPTRLQGLSLKVRSRIEYTYGLIENRTTNHLKETVKLAYYTTIYEVFKALGYGAEDLIDTEYKNRGIEDDWVPFILVLFWRESSEAFDEVIWRYKRELEYKVDRELKRSSYLNTTAPEVLENTSTLFRRDNKNLKALVETDSTFYSTEAQKEAFYDTSVEQALYCTIDDERRTEICTELDGSIIPVDEIEPWVNAPPMHYNCRSWLTPIITNIDYLDGKAYEMEGMDFDTWYDTWV